ncbi:MAG: stealth family protein [Streptosporangiales bacterium]
MGPVQELVPLSARRAIVRTTPDRFRAALQRAAARDLLAHRTRLAGRRERLRRRVAGQAGPLRTAVTSRGRTYVARSATAYRWDEVAASNVALVADALESDAIPYTALATDGLDRRLVVAASDRQRVLAALRAQADRPVYVLIPGGDGRPRPPRRLATNQYSKALKVFEFWGTGSGALLSGPELACTVEFWDAVTADGEVYSYGEALAVGALRAVRSNPWTAAIAPLERSARKDVDGRPRPVASVAGRPHLFRTRFPVDAVYTWVDGDDPAWQQRKLRRLAALDNTALPEHTAAVCRYDSHDELRYSLRSLEMFAPWIRRVYLVTDDQVPDWLDTDNPRIRVVSHRELFADSTALPTFNSHAIESQLYRLPGVSEHFIYFNDDFFLGRPVEPNLFFLSNGMARFFASTVKIGEFPQNLEDSPVMTAAKNNRDLIASRFGVTVTNRFQHTPYALRASVLRDMAEDFQEAFAATACAPFRSRSDIAIASSLHHYYAYATGRAVPGSIAYTYVDLGGATVERRLAQLLDKRKYDTFCINQTELTETDPEESVRLLQRFLDDYFPLASSFERAEASAYRTKTIKHHAVGRVTDVVRA